MSKLSTFAPSAQAILQLFRHLAVGGVVTGITQQEIADRVGVHHIQAANALQYLEASGRIEVIRGRIRTASYKLLAGK